MIWLQREDVAGKLTLKWKGFDEKERTDTHCASTSLASGESHSLSVAAQTIPSEGDTTVASYRATYRRYTRLIEVLAGGAIIDGQPESQLVHKSELRYVLTFAVAEPGVRVLLNYFSSAAPGAVDFGLYAHRQQRALTRVTNQSEPIAWTAWELIDGEKYTLTVRLSSCGGRSIEHGFIAKFETSKGGVQIQPVA